MPVSKFGNYRAETDAEHEERTLAEIESGNHPGEEPDGSDAEPDHDEPVDCKHGTPGNYPCAACTLEGHSPFSEPHAHRPPGTAPYADGNPPSAKAAPMSMPTLIAHALCTFAEAIEYAGGTHRDLKRAVKLLVRADVCESAAPAIFAQILRAQATGRLYEAGRVALHETAALVETHPEVLDLAAEVGSTINWTEVAEKFHYNDEALKHVRLALAALHRRTTDRIARGVEGVNKQ